MVVKSEEVGFLLRSRFGRKQPSLLTHHASHQMARFLPSLRSEEVGFEPTKHFRVYTLSKRAPSATRTLLQEIRELRLPQF